MSPNQPLFSAMYAEDYATIPAHILARAAQMGLHRDTKHKPLQAQPTKLELMATRALAVEATGCKVDVSFIHFLSDKVAEWRKQAVAHVHRIDAYVAKAAMRIGEDPMPAEDNLNIELAIRQVRRTCLKCVSYAAQLDQAPIASIEYTGYAAYLSNHERIDMISALGVEVSSYRSAKMLHDIIDIADVLCDDHQDVSNNG
jgi:hypothetical protein